ncbi:protein NLRC3-like, partial [Kryptolebias marmoratus]|uniref:protein NLRC3-like n=1 Tax=Kryptolebias marmoratus TaxID=37003 RepID=UPI0007F92020
MFYQEDLTQCGLDVTEASVYSGVCTEIFKRECVMFQKPVYCFVHLSVQEFLAAVYMFHCFTNKNTEVLTDFMRNKRMDSNPKSFFENISRLLRFQIQSLTLLWHSGQIDPMLQGLLYLSVSLFLLRTSGGSREEPSHLRDTTSLDVFLMKVLEKSLQSQNGHLDLFVRFLHGLSVESNQKLLGGLLGQIEISPEIIQRVIKNLKEMNTTTISPDRSINIFHCLMEMKDLSVHRDIQEFLKSENRSEKKLSE